MLIKRTVVGDNISVIIRVAYTHSAVIINSDVVVAVAYVELFIASVGFDYPMDFAVLFGYGNDSCDMRNEVVVIRTIFNNLF